MPGIVVCFSSLPGGGTPSFYHGSPRLGRGGLIMHRGIGFDRLRFFRLGGLARFLSVGNILFIVNHLKTSFVVK